MWNGITVSEFCEREREGMLLCVKIKYFSYLKSKQPLWSLKVADDITLILDRYEIKNKYNSLSRTNNWHSGGFFFF